MKKLLIALAILASVQVANAQGNKAVVAARSALETAKADAQNAKKNTKVATWLTLGKAYLTAFEAPAGNVLPGSSKQDLALMMGNEKPTSSENVTLSGQALVKEVYNGKNLYFNENGVLQFVEVTTPIVANALDEALAAYKKAAEIDTKGSKTKDISAAIQSIAQKLTEEAYTQYQLGDLAKASDLFTKAYEASATKPFATPDLQALYNAGFTAQNAGNLAKAKSAFQACIDNKYFGEDGDVFAKLADVVSKDGDAKGSKDILEKGFAQFPSSQAILIGLINYYVTSNEDTSRLFELIENAKKNEPTNASLYYVEGNIHKELGNEEKAIAAYQQCAKINPEYEYGFIAQGILYYDKAVDIQTKAQEELDDKKYMALVEEFEATLKACIAPFKQAFNTTKDDSVKVSIAEYLKNATYRFRDSSDEFKADYEKFSAIVSAGTAQ